ncbi:hypothetical protein BDW02DRAFT_221166 [Decorospora gaudefroyi]|uniref:UBA domain-containing protein n=1 Tax=Decorospora gaudefroyi TaxID=184978 RepID=A0A6A5KKI1_9PLEO|nr:hypothetical protein BDW02DRAFT_221166 [Decorospora gaudefroyi]
MYDGPIYATPIVLHGKAIHINNRSVPPLRRMRLVKVQKNAAKPDKVRWHYLFETARHAWSKMRFDPDPEALEKLKTVWVDQMEDAKDDEPVADTENLGDGAISAGTTTRAVQRIVIRQNLGFLTKKKRNHDKLLQFVINEFYGRQKRMRQSNLTKAQHHLVARFTDMADQYEDLYARIDDPDHDDSEEGEVTFADEEAELDVQRDGLIRQFQKELSRPKNFAGNTAVPKTRKPKASDAPKNSDEDEDLQATLQDRLETIKKFRALAGTDFEDAELILMSNSWDVHAALSYYYSLNDEVVAEEAGAGKTVGGKRASPNDEPTQEQLASIRSFIDVTGADYDLAKSYLLGTFWNSERAVSCFFADQDAANRPPPSQEGFAEADMVAAMQASLRDVSGGQDLSSTAKISGNHSSAAAEPRGTIQTDTGDSFNNAEAVSDISKINDKPAKHAQVGLYDSIKRQALDSSTTETAWGAKLGVTATRIQELISTQLKHCSAPKSQLEDAFFGPGMLELEDMTREESEEDALQTGLSHTGERIVIGPWSGLVTLATSEQGTPWEKYQAMRRRVQIQYYGHEAATSDPDPHRGIPMRERCPPAPEPEVYEDDDAPGVPTVPKSPSRTVADDTTAVLEAAELAEVQRIADAADAAEAQEIADAAEADELKKTGLSGFEPMQSRKIYPPAPATASCPLSSVPHSEEDGEKQDFATDFLADLQESEADARETDQQVRDLFRSREEDAWNGYDSDAQLDTGEDGEEYVEMGEEGDVDVNAECEADDGDEQRLDKTDGDACPPWKPCDDMLYW